MQGILSLRFRKPCLWSDDCRAQNADYFFASCTQKSINSADRSRAQFYRSWESSGQKLCLSTSLAPDKTSVVVTWCNVPEPVELLRLFWMPCAQGFSAMCQGVFQCSVNPLAKLAPAFTSGDHKKTANAWRRVILHADALASAIFLPALRLLECMYGVA